MDLELIASFGDHVPLSQFKSDDTISVLAFSQNGDFLASGDHAGRVVIFQISPPRTPGGKPVVSFVNQQHAHKSQFDFFRSELSEPKVQSLVWVKSNTINPLLMTINSHEARLWKLVQNVKRSWGPLDTHLTGSFKLPKPKLNEVKYSVAPVNVFNDPKTEYLIDVHTLPDQSSFLMVDVGGVKLWDMDRPIDSVNLYRLPDQNTELASSATIPTFPTAFLVADDQGFARLLDMRQQAEDLSPSIQFNVKGFTNKNRTAPGTEYIGSCQFSNDGINIVTRTFGEAQVWDIRKPNSPVATLDVQWYPGQMEWLSNDEYTKEVFRTTFTPDGHVLTGMYSADFVSWDWKNNKTKSHKAVSPRSQNTQIERGRDFTKRVTVCESHPLKNIVAVVSTAALYVFSEKSE